MYTCAFTPLLSVVMYIPIDQYAYDYSPCIRYIITDVICSWVSSYQELYMKQLKCRNSPTNLIACAMASIEC